jgi:hypothetical protein
MTRKQFMRYLKEKGIYNSFFRYAKRGFGSPESDILYTKFNGNIGSLIDFFILGNMPEEIIMQTIDWGGTPEGVDFWLNIHNELKSIGNGYKDFKDCV